MKCLSEHCNSEASFILGRDAGLCMSHYIECKDNCELPSMGAISGPSILTVTVDFEKFSGLGDNLTDIAVEHKILEFADFKGDVDHKDCTVETLRAYMRAVVRGKVSCYHLMFKTPKGELFYIDSKGDLYT